MLDEAPVGGNGHNDARRRGRAFGNLAARRRQLMAKRRISGAPVVNTGGAVVGMLTEGDLLAEGQELAPAFLEAVLDQHNKMKNVLSAGAVTVTEDVSAREIASLMCKRNVKRVPVMRDGKLVGMVARSDLIRAFAQSLDTRHPTVERTTVDEALRRAREKPTAHDQPRLASN